MRYRDRKEAGRRLARRLEYLRGQDVVVLGLPRGGVPVAHEVAHALGAPLDVLVVRKLGVPWQPELGFGAIGEGGVRVLNDDVIRETGLERDDLAVVEQAERAELDRRVRLYRGGRAPVPVAGRTVVIVDDGLATGATAEAACRLVSGRHAARIVLAVPVAPPAALARLRGAADRTVVLHQPRPFGSVGVWYHDFTQVTDSEVTDLLALSGAGGFADPPGDGEIQVPAGRVRLPARLSVPGAAPAVVAFAHGSGSSRHSPRNRYVADTLNRAGLGTLLLDLLSAEEEENRHNVFDIRMLAQRLHAAALWLRRETGLYVAYFGASTGAAAALEAAAAPDADVVSIVSRGGRPDLATPAALAHVQAPTLLVVGSADTRVLGLNRLAADWMRCEHRIAVVPGATHLFPEPGALAMVAELACDWFTGHLARPSAGASSGRPL
ncbi:phosphoribosyltransferase family protein [Streptomyces sp. NPDC058954]|uniref:phosphoribosyltransferase family protein n=1 Tax=Streptomyces sp. NPDC058954 TaxID=3346677 RepID=UPI0036ADC0E2